LDEPALWAGYCLDNQANVTINENTTITNLSAGSHRFQVFANDTAGNVGASSISNFTITKENSVNDILYNQASLVVLAIVIVIVAVASVSLVYFKRRKWKLASKQN
jgi:cobalamin biosynthesis Mg chelatase CobN